MAQNVTKVVKLGIFTVAMLNVTAVVSLRGLPAEAEYGMSSAFFYLFAAIVFLIPTAMVAAELAAMFQDKEGGIFRWVGEALGKRFGFLAQKAENAKVAIRNVRRDANDAVKKLSKANEISADEVKDLEDQVQKTTDKFVVEVDKMMEAKSKEILTV